MAEPFSRRFQRVARELEAERQCFLSQLPHRVPVTDEERSRWLELGASRELLESLGCIYSAEMEAAHG